MSIYSFDRSSHWTSDFGGRAFDFTEVFAKAIDLKHPQIVLHAKVFGKHTGLQVRLLSQEAREMLWKVLTSSKLERTELCAASDDLKKSKEICSK